MTHTRVGRLSALAAVVVVVTALVGCGGAGGASGAYKIGMSMDLSGPIAFNGKVAAAGLRAYIADLDSRGGVNGKKVDLKILDDASDLAKGRTNVQQFVSEKRLAIFGFILTNLATSTLPLATAKQTPIVGLGGPEALFRPVQPYYFSYELSIDLLPKAMLSYIATLAGKGGIDKPRVAIFSVDTPGNRDMVKEASKEITSRGWTLSTTQYMPVAPTDVTAQAAKIKASKPDFVLMSHNDAGALVAVRGLRAQGVDVPVVNQFAGSADTTFKQLGAGYSAFRSYASPTETGIPALAAMKKAATKAGEAKNMTNSYFTQGWVAGLLVEKALKACGTGCSSGTQFRNALESLGAVDTAGLSGPLAVSKSNHGLVSAVRFYGWDAASDSVEPQTDWLRHLG